MTRLKTLLAIMSLAALMNACAAKKQQLQPPPGPDYESVRQRADQEQKKLQIQENAQ